MILLFFKLLTIGSGVAVIASTLVDMVFLLAGYSIHLDDLFSLYVLVFFGAYTGVLVTK